MISTDTILGQPEKTEPAPDSRDSRQLTLEALNYHITLTKPIRDFQEAYYDYIKVVTRMRRARIVEKRRQALLQVLENIKNYYSTTNALHNDSTLLSDLKTYIHLTQVVLKEDFDKILDMEDIAEQSYDLAEAYELALDMAIEKLHNCFNTLRQREGIFFKKYNIKAKEDKSELVLKIQKTTRAMEYFGTINRIVARANRQNNYTSMAIQGKDLASLEQHLITLVSVSEEGLEKLQKQQSYDGDNELLLTAVEMLQFYKNEGQTTYPANVDFIIKTDNFQKMMKRFNEIKKKDRTQKDVNQYNNAVRSYNKEVKNINKLNSVSLKKGNKFIKLWNKKTERFFKEHT